MHSGALRENPEANERRRAVAIDLVDIAKGYLTQDVIEKASGYVGESSGATQKALGLIVPTIVSALMNAASTNDGAQQLTRTLDSGKYNGSVLNSVTTLFAGGLATQNGLMTGQGILESWFGSKLESVTDLITRTAGIRSDSASCLLALATPLVMNVLGHQRSSVGPDPASLASLLRSQRSMLSGLLPAGLGAVLGWSAVTSGAQNAGSSLAGTAARPPLEPEPASSAASQQRWFAPIFVATALALGALVWLSWPTATVREAARKISELQLPGGTRISVPEGSFNFSLAKWLASSNDTDLPKRFVVDNLRFENDSPRLTPESVSTVDTLMVVLRAYPAVSVALEGHTDSAGDPSANKKLSLARADAVKDIMVKGGIDGARIRVAGYGEENPIAPNETAQGRALNRRLELVVVKR
jgi:outer membrane protein OmpA-like peptidoglycan-associated protein